MSREFVMGARINLDTGRYSSSMADAIRSTNRFGQEIVDLDRDMGRYRDSQGRLREVNGRFAASAGLATRQLEEQGREATSLKEKLFSLQGVVTALAGSMAIKGAYNWLIGANADMETYQNTLTVVLGSQEKAVQQMAWAEKFAAKTPFEIPEIIEATTRLESYGIASKDVMGITGDMASVMGKDLMQAVEALADAQTGELERLKEFGITKGMIEEQAKLMGKAVTNNKGQITDQEQFNKTLFAIMEDRFKGGMDLQSTTFKGMLSNAADFMGSMGRQLGKPLFDKAKVGLEDFLGFLNHLESSGAVDRFVKGTTVAMNWLGNIFTSSGQLLKSTFGPTVSAIIKDFQYLGQVGSAAFDFLKTGDMSGLTDIFGQDKAAAIAGFIGIMRDGFVGFYNLMVGTVAPAIGQALSGIYNAVSKVASFIISNFGGLSPYIVGVAIAFAVYTAAIKAAALATKIAAAAQKAYNMMMAMNPTILIVIAIGLLIGALIHLAGGWDAVKQKLQVLWQYMVQAWTAIWAFLQPILTYIGQKAIQIWQYLVETVPPLLAQLWSILVEFFTNIWLAIQPLLVILWTGIMNIFNSIKAFWEQWGGLIMGYFTVMWAFISSIFKSALSIVWTIVSGAFQLILSVISSVFQMIVGVIEIGWSLISGIFSTALSLLSGDWEGAWDNMLSMLDGVWTGIEDFFGGLKDLFFESGKAIMNTLADGISAVASAPFDAIKSAFGAVRNLLPFSDARVGPLSNLTHNGGKIVSTIAEGVYQQAGTLHKAMYRTLEDTPTTTSGTVRANGYRINAGGSKGSGNINSKSSVKIEKGAITINGTGKDGATIGEEIIEFLYEKLSQADEVLSAADMEGLLYD